MKQGAFGIFDTLSSQRDWATRVLLRNALELFRQSERDRKRLSRYQNNIYLRVLGCYYTGLWHCETKRAVMILLTTIIIILITDARGQSCGIITVRYHGKQSWSIHNDKVNTEQKEIIRRSLCINISFFIYINKIQRDATVCTCLFTAKLLYIFRVSIAPIIKSTSDCNCSFWYRSYHVSEQQPSSSVAYRPRWRKVVVLILWRVPEAAVTVWCTPDVGCDRHPKHVD